LLSKNPQLSKHFPPAFDTVCINQRQFRTKPSAKYMRARPVNMRAWLKRHQLSAYFIVAYVVSWSIAVPLALQAQGIVGTNLPWALHYLTAFGPAVSAAIIAWATGQTLGGGGPVQRTAFTRRRLWWMVGFGAPLGLFAVAQLAAVLFNLPVPSWTALGHVNFLPALGLGAWVLWFATSGWGEELGWRGFALPRLQQSHSALTSSALLAIGWAGWHLPAFFYVPSYTALGLRILPGFFLGILCGAIVLTWLYNSSGRSVLAVVLWHASFNFVTASPEAGGVAAAVTSSLVMLWAIAILWRYDWESLSKRSMRWRSVRAGRNEKTRKLPGDEMIPQPIASLTNAVTIRCSPRGVWPWLAQMGAGSRAGWYSYDFLDNGRRPSATRIVPELQHLAAGMILPAVPGATDKFTVIGFERERFLIVGWLLPDRPPLMTWAFVLEEAAQGSTRLIVRARGGAGFRFRGWPSWLTKRTIPVIHFVMQQKQLIEIARRAEQHSDSSGSRSDQARRAAA